MSTRDEINPNHGVTTELRGQWHKLLAAVMVKLELEEIELTEQDIEALARPGGLNVVAHAGEYAIRIRLVDDAEGLRLARKEGGLRS